MLKILQARLQHTWTMNFQMFKRVLENQQRNRRWSNESSRKTSISALLTMPKPLTVWITTKCGKFWKRREYQTTWPGSWEICMQVRKQQLELDMEQQTGSKSIKKYTKAVYCHPTYLTYMQSTSWETLGCEEAQAGIKTAGRNNLRYADDTTLIAESKEELKSLLMEVKEENEKVGLKLNIQKTKITASGPITSWEIDGETVEAVSDFIFVGSKITADGDCSHEIKRCLLLLGRKVMTNLDIILKSRDINYFANKGLSHQGYCFFSSHVWMWELDYKESWVWRIDAFELWYWRRLLRIPWTTRRSNQSILKEISPECSLEGVMLKLKLQYLGHLIRRTHL